MKIKKKVLKYTSRKYLEWAEILPKFQSGFLYELQLVREHQRRLSKTFNARYNKPKKANILLKKIRIVRSFQLEEFHLIEQALNKLFPNCEEITNFVNKLRDDTSSIRASSWKDIGVIINDKGFHFSRTKRIDELPKDIEYVQISYDRIMPSLACLSFTFNINKEFSKELNQKQTQENLPEIIFKKVNPFQPFRSGYTMAGDTGVILNVRGHISSYVSELDKWLENRIRFGKQPMLPMSIIEYYKCNQKIKDDKAKWITKYSGWLSSYGISISGRSFWGNDSLFCKASYPDKKLPVSIITTFKNNKKDDSSKYFDLTLKLNSLSVLSAINSSLNLMQNMLEKQRKIGFKYLAKYDTKILGKNENINSLKRIGTLLKRFQLEIEENRDFINFSLEGINEVKLTYQESELSMIKSEFDNINYRIEGLRKSSNIVDMGLTDYLGVQNIHAMYKLQKWMFILSIVVTLATIVSVLSSWDNLVKVWDSLICAIESSL